MILKKLMLYVLAVGNYCNGKSKRGGAFGFAFKSLDKISCQRTFDNKKLMM